MTDDPKAQRPLFVEQVMRLFADADMHEALWWRFDDGEISLFAMCNDVFFWACADAEEITPDSLPDLQRTYDDTVAIGAVEWLPELYAARRRRMRPQGAAYPKGPPTLIALFDECGPEREVGFDNPKAPPAAAQPADGST